MVRGQRGALLDDPAECGFVLAVDEARYPLAGRDMPRASDFLLEEPVLAHRVHDAGLVGPGPVPGRGFDAPGELYEAITHRTATAYPRI